MKKMPRRYLRYVLAAPLFMQAVARARQTSGSVLNCDLDMFQDDPWLLYSCIWYAVSEGVTITFPAEPGATKE